MSIEIEEIKLADICWPRGVSARMWFCQPKVELTTPAPFQPTPAVRALDILRAVFDRDARMGPPVGDAPSIILLPEMSLAPGDLTAVRSLIKAARPNTLLICGIGHMTAPEIDQIEASTHLCGDPVAAHYANCAMVGRGGTEQIFLQPKIVPSRHEFDCHWPGRLVRFFDGRFFSFVVFICSEMLDRAQALTTMRDVLKGLAERNLQLGAVFWLQHNRDPRSVEFSQSLEDLKHLDRPTVFVISSRNQCPPRLENFAVSGALFKKSVLPRHFSILTRQFHYVEPVSNSAALSRVVLLRYDVDVNLVETTLASAIDDDDGTPRSQLFATVVPLVMRNGALADNVENTHLSEILRRARDVAAATDTGNFLEGCCCQPGRMATMTSSE